VGKLFAAFSSTFAWATPEYMLDEMSLDEILTLLEEYAKLKAPDKLDEEEQNEQGRRRARILMKDHIRTEE